MLQAMFVPPVKTLHRMIYYLTLPLRIALYLTLPDVRTAGYEYLALLTMVVSLGWLFCMSYVLIVGLTFLCDLLGVSGMVAGLTVAAWAASYPALWSSVVLSRNRLGDLSICNALGSNTFNNFIGRIALNAF